MRSVVLSLVAGVLLCVGSAGAETAWEKLLANDGVGSANPRFDNVPQPTLLAPGFTSGVVARGNTRLENPSGLLTRYGTINDFPPQPIEATKTEPDQNTYVKYDHNPGGPDAGFDYGRHFLYQGHESGGEDRSSITRVNLDVPDPAHHITLLTPVDGDGLTHFNELDGSVFDPFTKTLFFTQEAGGEGGVIEVPADFTPDPPTTLYGIFGRASFEGVRIDDQGTIYLVEDAGGTSVNVVATDPASPKAAKLPNSFVYRLIPTDKHDISKGGRLQVLQASVDGAPVVFVPIDGGHPTGDVFSATQLKLHKVGTSYPMRWVTIHDTAVDGTADFDANALAKAGGGTPFKRPENIAFLPASSFRTFFFTPTGDTSADSGNQFELARRGAWGSVFRVDLATDRATGTLSIAWLGDSEHASFDNLTFVAATTLLVGEDRGDSLHKQLSRLDSVWAFDVAHPGAAPVRFIALGRDVASTQDAHFLDTKLAGFQNEGDNEPTGLASSDGDSTEAGLLGVKAPDRTFRVFFTQQHGANITREIFGHFD